MKNLELQQKTPIQVLHRRPNSIQSRTVYKMNAKPISKDQLNHVEDLDTDLDLNETQQVFRLRLTTQAGTYVKDYSRRFWKNKSQLERSTMHPGFGHYRFGCLGNSTSFFSTTNGQCFLNLF
jgi:hypothetical protein